MTRPVYLVDGARTPFIKARGKPGPFSPVDLAVQCGRPLMLRQPFGPDAIDLVILGCVNVVADETTVVLYARRGEIGIGDVRGAAQAATSALAYCVAALKARARGGRQDLPRGHD